MLEKKRRRRKKKKKKGLRFEIRLLGLGVLKCWRSVEVYLCVSLLNGLDYNIIFMGVTVLGVWVYEKEVVIN